jgi:hypothetical protein
MPGLTKWLQATGGYLVGQLIVFALLKLIFRVDWLELVVPYLVFAASVVTTVLGAGALNSWGGKKLTPRQFGFGASLWFAFFLLSINCAWFYLAFVLHIFSQQFFDDPSNYGALLVFPIGLAFSVPAYWHGYRVQKIRIEKREKAENPPTSTS